MPRTNPGKVHRQRWTRSDYYRLGELGMIAERTELIDGDIYVREPVGPAHSTSVGLISAGLRRCIDAERFLVRPQEPLTLGESEPFPDVAVVSGTARDFAKQHPTTACLVVEVSDSTLRMDRNKAKLYARHEIPEYWIVNVNDRHLEVHRTPRNGTYTHRFTVPHDGQIEALHLDQTAPLAIADIII